MILNALSITVKNQNVEIFIDSPERIVFDDMKTVTVYDQNVHETDITELDVQDQEIHIVFSEAEMAKFALTKMVQCMDTDNHLNINIGISFHQHGGSILINHDE